MIKLWTYNELAADIDSNDTSLGLHFPRPGRAGTTHTVQIDDELIQSSTWGAFTDLSAVAVSSLKRARQGTAAARHKAGTPVWVDWNPNYRSSDTIANVAVLQYPEANARVAVLAADGRGGFFGGGTFASIGSGTYIRAGLARWHPNGYVDKDFSPSANNAIWGMAYDPDNEILYITGAFTRINGLTAEYGAAISAETGALLYNFDLQATGNWVHINGDRVFFGGTFTDAGGITRNKACSFTLDTTSGPSWTLDDWNPNMGGGDVRYIFATDDQVYMAGNFLTIDGTARNYLASVDPIDATLTNWNPAPDSDCYMVKEINNNVYVGGDYANIGGITQDSFARVDNALGVADSTFAAEPDARVRSVVETDDDKVIIVGDFANVNATARDQIAMVDLVDGSLEAWNPGLGAPTYHLEYSGTTLGVAGEFTSGTGAPRDNMLVYSTTEGASHIGRYKCEGEITIDEGDELQYAQWIVLGPALDTVMYTGHPINEFKAVDGTVRVPGPDIIMAHPYGIYTVKLLVTTLSGVTTHRASFSLNTSSYAYIIPDGTESGDPFTASDTFAAPTVGKVTNTYTITLGNQTGSPSATNDTYFYRIFAVLGVTEDPTTGGAVVGHDRLVVAWGATVETLDHAEQALYSTRAYSNANSSAFNLVVTARNNATDDEVSTTVASHPAASSSNVNPDQVQVEREARVGGTLAGHQRVPYPSHWVSTPGTFQVVYSNQGPTAYEYRYRYRYRDFRRDGVSNERGPVEVTSAWSSWSAWT